VRNIIAGAFLALAVSACARSQSGSPPTETIPDVFPSIPEIRAQNGVATLRLDAILSPEDGAPSFSYEGTIGVTPTIRVSPGDAIDLTLANDLPVRPNQINAVNIHFHGLTVSPNPPGDDTIATLARPGQTLHYFVKIPPEQEPGLYWYHPHSHGESYREVTGGMSGAIVVEGLQQHLPALAAMKERIIILRDVPTSANYVDADMPLQLRTGSKPPIARARAANNGSPCRAEQGLQPTLNRIVRAKIGIEPGERQFFRVINASAARHFDLSIDGSRLQLVAVDGVALDAYPGTPAERTVSHVVIPPAGRAEFVVTGLDHPTVMRSACYDSGSAGDPDPAVVLADLIDPRSIFSAPAAARAAIAGAAEPERLAALQTLPQADHGPALPPPAARRTIRFTEDANGFYIDGKAFAMSGPPSIVARSGTVEDWTILNRTNEVHDFHIHQIHFAAERIDGRPVTQPIWQDTIVVRPRGSVELLMDFRDPIVRGTFLYHCHILDHEDQGMMAKIRVI
jgi:FtsP/CotA-like multicopper oxidase with cupredoxin domain